MESDAQPEDFQQGSDLPKIRAVGPENHGWIVRAHATDRQMNALTQTVEEGRIFATETEFDEFWMENE